SCYCLFPLILYNGFYIVLSNVLIPEATSPFALLSDFCYLVTAVLLLIAITVVHDFSFFKAIGTALATVFSMAIVACVLFAMLTLWVNLAGWILGLYYEATLR
ncbi:MAG: hypothetical protein IJT66_05925, partial [Clostridia bacterium]|nr:hypothetical protein [Clostridia bacterium]